MSNMGDGMSLPYICDSRQDMLESRKYLIRNVTMKAQSPPNVQTEGKVGSLNSTQRSPCMQLTSK